MIVKWLADLSLVVAKVAQVLTKVATALEKTGQALRKVEALLRAIKDLHAALAEIVKRAPKLSEVGLMARAGKGAIQGGVAAAVNPIPYVQIPGAVGTAADAVDDGVSVHRDVHKALNPE
jgi:ABC-type transporter Mla subunit MlaD